MHPTKTGCVFLARPAHKWIWREEEIRKKSTSKFYTITQCNIYEILFFSNIAIYKLLIALLNYLSKNEVVNTVLWDAFFGAALSKFFCTEKLWRYNLHQCKN